MYQFMIFHIVMISLFHSALGDNIINQNKLNFIYSWKTIDYHYPSQEERNQAINDRSFVPGAAIPIDVDLHYHINTGTRIFMTTPRLNDGIPTTVGYVSSDRLFERSSNSSALIKPYPNYEMNRVDGNCNHIISVYRVKVDECNRLWVVDTGIYKDVPVCPPKILLFNLLNNQLISTYTFDLKSIMNNTQFITPVVDIRNGQCNNAFVYLADVERYQLFVYDHANRKSWSIRNRHFYPNPDHGTFTINNLSFDLMDGLFGMALGPILTNGDRILYFHALASLQENFVPTSVIRNSKNFEANPGAKIDSFKQFSYQRESQSASEAMSNNGILFYGSLSENSIKCWNSASPFNEYHIDTVLKINQMIEFTAGVKIAKSWTGSEMLIVNSIAYQKLVNGVMNPNEINVRLWGTLVDELIPTTRCAYNYHHHHHHHNHQHHNINALMH